MPLYYHKLNAERLSDGFDEYGYPLEHNSAKDAGCNIIINPDVQIPEEGIEAYAPFVDLSESTPDGQHPIVISTAYSQPTISQFSRVNCLRFTDTVMSVQSISYNLKQFTISYWAYPDSNAPAASLNGIAGWLNANPQPGTPKTSFGLAISDNGKLVLTYCISNSSMNSYVTDVDVGSVLHHCAFVIDIEGKSASAYLDGVLKTTVDSSVIGTIGSGTAVSFGGRLPFMSNQFSGYITAFRLYSRVLDDSEIVALANEFHPVSDI